MSPAMGGLSFMPSMAPMPGLPIMPPGGMPPIIAIPSCMSFMCSAISALRSCGVLACIILSCITRMDFMCSSMRALATSWPPIGMAGAAVGVAAWAVLPTGIWAQPDKPKVAMAAMAVSVRSEIKVSSSVCMNGWEGGRPCETGRRICLLLA
jgi:hypothetical protein